MKKVCLNFGEFQTEQEIDGALQGQSYKKGGAGRGLTHAVSTIESFGGKLSVTSEKGKGSKVSLKLPVSRPPSWFLDKIEVPHEGVIVILDDEPCVHDELKHHFQGLGLIKKGIDIISFSEGHELINWVKGQKDIIESCVFLIDLNLKSRLSGFLSGDESISDEPDGIDVVEELGIGSRSVLISSRKYDNSLKDRSCALGMKLCPKELISSVPVKIREEKILIEVRSENYDVQSKGLSFTTRG